jgi:hypothetical protein
MSDDNHRPVAAAHSILGYATAASLLAQQLRMFGPKSSRYNPPREGTYLCRSATCQSPAFHPAKCGLESARMRFLHRRRGSNRWQLRVRCTAFVVHIGTCPRWSSTFVAGGFMALHGVNGSTMTAMGQVGIAI